MFPSNPANYTQFFKDLAEHHPAIAATDSNGRFVTISQSSAPFASWDKSAFTTGNNSQIKSKESNGHKLIFILIMMDEDSHGNALNLNVINGSFLLLKPTEKNNHTDKLNAYQEAYSAGKDIMAWVEEYFSLNRHLGSLQINACNNEAIGPVPVNNMFGWIFNFAFSIRKNTCVTPAIWGEFIPKEEEE